MLEEDETKAKLRRARRSLKKLRKSMSEPPMDKMVRQPEQKKDIWKNLAQREADIHSGDK